MYAAAAAAHLGLIALDHAIAFFDRTEAGRKLTWDERLTWDIVETPGGKVTVVGL